MTLFVCLLVEYTAYTECSNHTYTSPNTDFAKSVELVEIPLSSQMVLLCLICSCVLCLANFLCSGQMRWTGLWGGSPTSCVLDRWDEQDCEVARQLLVFWTDEMNRTVRWLANFLCSGQMRWTGLWGGSPTSCVLDRWDEQDCEVARQLLVFWTDEMNRTVRWLANFLCSGQMRWTGLWGGSPTSCVLDRWDEQDCGGGSSGQDWTC